MASVAEIQMYAKDLDAARRAAHSAQVEVERIEAKYSRYRDDSALTAINRAAGGSPVAIDAETSALLDYADACFRQSDGLFDITSGVLRRAWDFSKGVPPAAEAVAALLPRVGWSRVRRDEASIALEAGMEIDFGGIGKEYAADRAAATLQQAGIASAMVNLGGDLRALGSHPGGKPWRVGIVDPRASTPAAPPIALVQIDNMGLATSGDYERFFVHEGQRYSHILDPRTGWPVVDGPRSVSVVAPLAIVAGSCATIAMLKGADAYSYLMQQQSPFLLIDGVGNVSKNL